MDIPTRAKAGSWWPQEDGFCSTCRFAAAELDQTGNWELCPVKHQSQLRLSPAAVC